MPVEPPGVTGATEDEDGGARPHAAGRQERLYAIGLAVLVPLSVGLGIWGRVIDSEESGAATQLTAARIHIEKITNLRRDTRKAHVALLESWLAPEEKRAEAKPGVEKLVATVAGEHEEFRALPATEPAEDPARERLAAAGEAWIDIMRSTLTEGRGPDRLAEHKSALAVVDKEVDVVLTMNSKHGEAVDGRIAVLRARQERIGKGFLATVLASVGLALLWRARRRADARILDANRREEARAAKLRAQFFQRMSHELRTPLVSISNVVKTLDNSDLTADRRTEIKAHIENEARDLLGMINNILDLAKLESAHAELLVEDVALTEVIDRCVSRCRPLIGDKPVTLDVELADADVKVRADFVKLQQVFTNLIANAIKFTEEGSVSVRAHPADGGRVSVEVRDTGIGIEGPALDTIWSAFRQADSRIGKKFGGTGLGLAIAKGVLDRLDGTVRVSSEVGKGTTFTVTLPEAPPAAPS